LAEGWHMLKFVFALSALFLSSIAVCGEVYMWTDKKGVKRFSNTPVTSQYDSKKVKSIGQEINYTAPSPEYQSSESRRKTNNISEIELPETIQTKGKAAQEVTSYKIEWKN
jgi:hypothetical protein